MKRLLISAAGIVLFFALMFAEYRIIMHNIQPYLGQGNTVYLDLFGYTDTYYAEPVNQD